MTAGKLRKRDAVLIGSVAAHLDALGEDIIRSFQAGDYGEVRGASRFIRATCATVVGLAAVVSGTKDGYDFVRDHDCAPAQVIDLAQETIETAAVIIRMPDEDMRPPPEVTGNVDVTGAPDIAQAAGHTRAVSVSVNAEPATARVEAGGATVEAEGVTVTSGEPVDPATVPTVPTQ